MYGTLWRCRRDSRCSKADSPMADILTLLKLRTSRTGKAVSGDARTFTHMAPSSTRVCRVLGRLSRFTSNGSSAYRARVLSPRMPITASSTLGMMVRAAEVWTRTRHVVSVGGRDTWSAPRPSKVRSTMCRLARKLRSSVSLTKECTNSRLGLIRMHGEVMRTSARGAESRYRWVRVGATCAATAPNAAFAREAMTGSEVWVMSVKWVVAAGRVHKNSARLRDAWFKVKGSRGEWVKKISRRNWGSSRIHRQPRHTLAYLTG